MPRPRSRSEGKVEASVGHAQKTPLRGLRFERLDDGQTYLDRWEQRWADTRIHGSTKRQVAAMFEEERPALGPLPLEPFRYDQYGRRSVHLDGCVEVASAYYSAPPDGSDAASTCSGTTSTFASSTRAPANCCASTCAPSGAGIASPTTTGPPAPRRRPSPCSPPPSGPVPPSRRLRPHPPHEGAAGVRRILGVLSLVKKHGPAVVEHAATAALELGVPTYRFLKRYLDRHPGAPPLSLRQVDPLIRELTVYRDLIDRRTETAH